MWVSGVWRVTPPGRKWTPGHWITTAGGYRWVSGFWESDGVGELEYRQPPPESLELGPSSEAPSEIHFWAPGCWVPFDYEYRWRPGYWHPYQENWVWVPACYIWTPSGCLYISGYWDYRFALRGQLFAPVYFPNRIYGQPGFYYSPSCIVDSGIISLHLFVRPDCRHYYFGDYYGPAYYGRQIYPFFELHVSGRGYDPLYVHNCLHFKQRGVDYAGRIHNWHRYLCDHSDHRPPHTLHAQSAFATTHKGDSQLQYALIGRSLSDVAPSRQPGRGWVSLGPEERRAADHERERVRSLRHERTQLETVAASPPAGPSPQALPRGGPRRTLRLNTMANNLGPDKKGEGAGRPEPLVGAPQDHTIGRRGMAAGNVVGDSPRPKIGAVDLSPSATPSPLPGRSFSRGGGGSLSGVGDSPRPKIGAVDLSPSATPSPLPGRSFSRGGGGSLSGVGDSPRPKIGAVDLSPSATPSPLPGRSFSRGGDGSLSGVGDSPRPKIGAVDLSPSATPSPLPGRSFSRGGDGSPKRMDNTTTNSAGRADATSPLPANRWSGRALSGAGAELWSQPSGPTRSTRDLAAPSSPSGGRRSAGPADNLRSTPALTSPPRVMPGRDAERRQRLRSSVQPAIDRALEPYALGDARSLQPIAGVRRLEAGAEITQNLSKQTSRARRGSPTPPKRLDRRSPIRTVPG